MKLKNTVRRCRFDHGEMSQEELADAIGVSRQTIHSIEKGKFVPSTLLALKIARFFVLLTFGVMAGLSMGQWSLAQLWVFLPFYVMILTPYVINVAYWLVLKRGMGPDDWYDEKQLRDLMKSSLATLLFSMPGM